VKLTPGIDFTNYLAAAFAQANPKSAKRHRLDYLFALLGSEHVKAVQSVGEIATRRKSYQTFSIVNLYFSQLS